MVGSKIYSWEWASASITVESCSIRRPTPGRGLLRARHHEIDGTPATRSRWQPNVEPHPSSGNPPAWWFWTPKTMERHGLRRPVLFGDARRRELGAGCPPTPTTSVGCESVYQPGVGARMGGSVGVGSGMRRGRAWARLIRGGPGCRRRPLSPAKRGCRCAGSSLRFHREASFRDGSLCWPYLKTSVWGPAGTSSQTMASPSARRHIS